MKGIVSYRQLSVASAPPERVLIMLYQCALLRMECAVLAIEEGKEVDAMRDLHHARAVICELMTSLDFDTSPDLCTNLESLYHWSLRQLVQAGRDVDATPVREVLHVMSVLLEGWQEALRKIADQPMAAQP